MAPRTISRHVEFGGLSVFVLLPLLVASQCELPRGWSGIWWVRRGQLAISENSMAGEVLGSVLNCVHASNNTFVFRSNTNCYTCYEIIEKHPNVLQYRAVRPGTGMCRMLSNQACMGQAGDTFTPMYMIRKGASVTCPQFGVVPFTYQKGGEYCGTEPSMLTSTDKQLYFSFKPCDKMNRGNYESSLQVQCVGAWRKDSTMYLMARLGRSSRRSPERYACFNYTRSGGHASTYIMGQASSERCDYRRHQDPTTYYIHTNGAENMVFPQPKLRLSGPGTTHVLAQSHDHVTLTCTAPVPLNFGADSGPQQYLMKWLRLVGRGEETVTSNHYTLLTDRGRVSLSLEHRGNSSTEYDLVINPVQVSDSGLYICVLFNNDYSLLLTRNITLSVAQSPPVVSCVVPPAWRGTWWDKYEFNLDISDTQLGEAACMTSSGNRFLLRQHNNCKVCYIITEKHHNLLQYRKSPCSFSEDLNEVCSKVEYDLSRYLIRKAAAVTCPFVGERNYIFQDSQGGCTESASRLSSRMNDTELLFLYNPCPQQSNINVISHPNPVKCVATWSDGATHYLMGQLNASNYVCYTYVEELGERWRYSMSQAGSEECSAWGGVADKIYRIFGNQHDARTGTRVRSFHAASSLPLFVSSGEVRGLHFLLSLLPCLYFLLHRA